MDWLLNILRRLFGLQKSQTEEAVKVGRVAEKPASRPAKPVEKKPESSPPVKPAIKVDGHKIFETLDPMVEPLLREMAEAQLGYGFVYQAQPESLKWSIWNTNTNSFVTKFWSITLIPDSARLKIRCAQNERVDSGLSESEFKEALAKASKIGPAIRNIPVENILNEQI